MFKNKPFWVSLAILAAYLLLGYFAVPPLLHPRLEQFAARQAGLPVQFGELRFDPITWSAELFDVRLRPEAQDSWPGLSLTAEKVHVRFNFWRLTTAVSELVLHAPELVVEGDHPIMLSEMPSGMPLRRYPFVDQWHQWQARSPGSADGMPIRVRNWRVEGGRVLLREGPTAQTAKVLMDEVYVHVGKAASEGLRPYQLAFRLTDEAVGLAAGIRLQGEMAAGVPGSSGSYQVELTVPAGVKAGRGVAAADGANLSLGESTHLALKGGFKATGHFHHGLIELRDGQISSAEATSACVMEGLVCAVLSPLQGSFNASLTAATDGFRLLKAETELEAFTLGAWLAERQVELSGKQLFEAARITLTGPADQALEDKSALQTEPVDSAFDFEAELQSAPGERLSIQGKWTPATVGGNASIAAGILNTRFVVSGRHSVQGQVKLQGAVTEADEVARSRFSFTLENPEATLAQDFIGSQLAADVNGMPEIAALQMRASGSIDASRLDLTENIHLVDLRYTAEQLTSRTSSFSATESLNTQQSAATHLLPWLQNPHGDIVLLAPAVQMPLTDSLKVGEVLRAPVIDLIRSFREQPLPALAAQLGFAGQELEELRFEAGMAALDASSSATIKALAAMLLQRPALGLEWAGVFDPLVDLKALQTEQIRTHIALAMAADLSFQSGSVPPDFTDPIVHSVIDEFARRRLPSKVLASFAEHFGAADVDQGVIPEGDVAAYYSSLFELLVDYAEIPQGALTTLARYRAQAVADGLEEQGVAAEQWQLSDESQAVAARLDGVPLPLNLEPRFR